MRQKANRFWACLPVLLGLLVFSSCDDEKSIDYADLPSGARTLIETYFDADVVSVIRDKDDGTKEYEVRLSDGTEMLFDEGGTWLSIECYSSPMPTGFLLPNIATEVSQRHPDGFVHGADRELGGYEVEVIDQGKDWNMRFDTDGNFVVEHQDTND